MRNTLITILLLACLPTALAYVKAEDYNGIKLKFYDDRINKTSAYQILAQIPNESLAGLHYIKFHYTHASRGVLGFYSICNGITVYSCQPDCDIWIVEHEIAHHCQCQAGDYSWQIKRHVGRFEACLGGIE